MTAIRLPRQSSRDSQDETISFFWNNKKLKARKGDSISAALLANEQQIIGRSFKYHRARSVTSAGVEEAGALVTTGKGAHTEPNVRASTTELSEGLFVYSQNAWPSVRFDIGSILNVFGKFFAAGFYYKTFMGKKFRSIPPLEWGGGTGIWMFFEKFIRKAAGLGTASRLADPDNYEHLHTHTDILVIGSGPAGIQSAVQAAQSGKDVLLVEQDYAIGGDYLSWQDKSEFKTQISKLNKQNITVLTRTTAFGLYDDTTIGLIEIISPEERTQKPLKPRQRFHICRAERVILATGALERNYAFVNNDLPGIMTVSSARTYLNRYQLLVGSNIVISTNNDSAYETGLELENAGATVTILESREQIGELLLKQILGRSINLY
ncbi:MAG: 2Fe-2S iron-sulfur cluster-binding protein, partial [Alphaproteobacteria bacterium]